MGDYGNQDMHKTSIGVMVILAIQWAFTSSYQVFDACTLNLNFRVMVIFTIQWALTSSSQVLMHRL